MGGTIKLVTNSPKLHALEGAAYVDASQTTGGSTNGRGSLMLNVPLGDIASLRFVTTGKYISGWIHRYVVAPGQFPFPTNFGNCGVYSCSRGDVQDAPVAKDISNSNKGSRPGGVNLPIPLVPFSQGAFYYCGPGTGPSYLTSQPSYYAPDNIWSIEVGEKARFADRRFSVNADVYYVKWHNIQQLVVLSCGYPYNTNVGDAKTYGPELEMAAKVTDALTVDLSAAYTQAYISEPKNTPGLPLTSGTRVTSIPKYTGSVAVNYESTLGQDYKMTFRVSEAYVGPVYDTAFFQETLGSYGLMDFRMGVGKEAWTASLFGTNLTNKHAGLTIDNTVFAWQQPTITRVSTNQPRTIGIAFETKF